ncbi:hypothetical protein VPH35_071337 [Triticum aestivum]
MSTRRRVRALWSTHPLTLRRPNHPDPASSSTSAATQLKFAQHSFSTLFRSVRLDHTSITCAFLLAVVHLFQICTFLVIFILFHLFLWYGWSRCMARSRCISLLLLNPK